MKTRKLNIKYSGNPPEITITGNADGLRFLAEICNRVIDKPDSSAHWHLMEKMGTLETGSVDTVICFEE